MQQSLSDIIDRLDQAGFDISIAERIESHTLLLLVDSQLELKLGLRMLFAKNRQQQQLFDLLWDLGEIQPEEKEPEQERGKPIESLDLLPQYGSTDFCANGVAPGGSGGQAQGMGSGLPGMDGYTALIRFDSSFKGTVRQLLQGNIRNAAANMLRLITEATYTIDQLMQAKGEAIAEIEYMLREVAPQHTDYLLKEMEQEYLKLIKERMDIMDNLRVKNPLSAIEIEDLPLISLAASPELSLTLRKLGRKLASKHKRRKRHGNQKINLRQTIRANIQHGGTIIELRKQKKRKEKPNLLLLTDISSSTLHATRLFLTIIWHAKEVFRDIRFYQFIGSCFDVTTEFKTAKSIDEGMKRALNNWNAKTEGRENSDYYRAFLKFERYNQHRLRSSTTVIVLGDLRDWLGPWTNNVPQSSVVLGRIGKRVKRVIVLNPEPKTAWDTGDSICKYCINEGIDVYETTSLAQLIDVILNIID
ncbi:MAG: VWA domain-containing protein [Candidatus Heimdallarchaeota archaeon]|nr:VWA domain-containing protein [Candidatus Heimdallarchaeota archaeon]